MPDDPIIVSGGSLRIKANDKLGEGGVDTEGKRVYHHSKKGKITRVTIDGKDFPAHEKSEIVIHYDVP